MSLLSDALKSKLIPWSHQNNAKRFIVAREKMSAAQMPDGITLVRRKIVGPRVVIKNSRLYENVRGLRAHWPDAGLGERAQCKMICVLDGQIDFQLGHYAVQCGKGFYLVIPPGTIGATGERPYYAEGSFCDVLHVILHPHAIQCCVVHGREGERLPHIQENYLFKDGSLVALFDLIMQGILTERKNASHIAANLLIPFWEMLEREIEDHCYINPGPIGRPVIEHEKLAGFEAELLHYIQTHLNQHPTLDNAAKALYLSRTQLVRKIRQKTGKTFIQFLNDYRIAEAKVLLRDSDWTISAIAGFLGFSSSTYFHSVFRQETQKTPLEYRKAARQK